LPGDVPAWVREKGDVRPFDSNTNSGDLTMMYYVSIKEILNNAENGMYQDASRQEEIEKSWHMWDWSDSELRDKMVQFVSYLKSIADCKRINIDTMCVSFNSFDPSFRYQEYTDTMRIKDSRTNNLLYLFQFRYDNDNNEYVEVLGPGNFFKEVLVSGSWTDVVQFFRSPLKKSKRK
jgi:hypothetical protein